MDAVRNDDTVINETSAIIQVVPGVERAPSRVVNFERRDGSSGKLEMCFRNGGKNYGDILICSYSYLGNFFFFIEFFLFSPPRSSLAPRNNVTLVPKSFFMGR